ncbi:MAG: TonB-dependent receptor domain-containing protein [bacterium]
MDKHIKTYLTLVCVLLLSVSAVWAQNGTISGTVNDAEGNPLPGANVAIVGTNLGAATADDGSYTISNVPAGDYTLKATFIGYDVAQIRVTVVTGETATSNFALTSGALPGETLVVSASRRPQKLTDAPASISVVTAKDLSKSTGFTYGEGLMKAKGVDVYRSGVDGVGINARGFMTAYSYRMQLMADGKNGMLPGAGLAAGNLFPVARDDIERLEVILGPSSAMYGPNAHNGLVNIITKHPRDSQGTILTVGGGNRSTFISRLRHAQIIGDKLAFKVNAEYLTANEFEKNDTTGVSVDPNSGQVTQVFYENPDFDIQNLRMDASAYFSFTNDIEAIGTFGYSNTNTIGTTNVGRNQIDGWVYKFYQLRLNSPHFFVQGYLTTNEAGDSYAIDNAAALEQALGFSREQAVEQIKYVDNSKRYNLEAQANFDWQGIHFVGGISHEDNRPVSNGTFLSDTTGRTIKLKQTGFYAQVERDLGESFKVVLAGRLDTHSSYDDQFSPRAALVYRLRGKGAFRFTYNRAFQAPAILQQELFLPFGFAAPGIPIMLRGNGRGLTLADGTQISPLEVEENETFELGYKGLITDKLYFDINVYQSDYQNFISPLQVVGNLAGGNPVVKMGDGAITAPELTLTYRNFGRVKMKGLDLGLTYQVSNQVNFWFNYSLINPEDIKDRLDNDLNGDGTVSDSEAEALSFNTPENKFNFGIAISNIFTHGTYASLSMRHIDEYDFISGRHRATAAGEGTGAFQFKDRGPLGGFETFDLNLSYAMRNGVTVNFSVSNIFDTGLREFAASPEIGRLITGELKYNFNLARR